MLDPVPADDPFWAMQVVHTFWEIVAEWSSLHAAACKAPTFNTELLKQLVNGINYKMTRAILKKDNADTYTASSEPENQGSSHSLDCSSHLKM